MNLFQEFSENPSYFLRCNLLGFVPAQVHLEFSTNRSKSPRMVRFVIFDMDGVLQCLR